MLSLKIGLPQYKNSPPKAQTLCNVLDIPVAAWNTNSATQQLSNSATQQLSNSATQQLSNSATQQLSNSATRLCPDKRAFFSFRQRHHYIFSSIFADDNRAVNLFHIKPQRVPRMRRVLLSSIQPCILLNASFLQSKKHRYCVEPPPSVAVLRAMYRIRHLKPYHFLYALRLH